MNTSVRALALIGIACALAGCAVAPGSLPVASSADGARQGAGPVAFPADPQIDWDHPFKGQGHANVDPAMLAVSPQSFGTTVHPVTPRLPAGKLRWVDVSPHGTVAFMYDFAGDPAFPTDGRVVVEESESTMTQDEYINGGDWAGTQNSVTAVGAITILVRSYQGLADASFVYDGTLYDIKGPDLGPGQALNIAMQLAKQLS